MEDIIGDVGIIFCVLALSRTLLVFDGVLDFHGYGSIVYRISSCLRGIASSSEQQDPEIAGAVARAPHPSGSEGPRKFWWVS